MRLYDGAPRHNYEDVLRAIGAILDQRGMREMTLVELDDGFVVQGLALSAGDGRTWGDLDARLEKETVHLLDEDVARMTNEAVARRRERGRPQRRHSNPDTAFYEAALRVLGAYIDQQQPRDIFLLEQERQFIMRLLMSTRVGLRHVLVEFTRPEIEAMVASARPNRGR